MSMLIETRAAASRWIPVPLRLVMGSGFVIHGWAKLSRGPEGFGRLLEFIGVPWPQVTAWIATFLELLGGCALLLGAFVTVASVPLAVMMVVALSKVHLRYGFSSINTIGLGPDGPRFGPPGYEVNLLYVAGLLVLVLSGSGPLSVDSWLSARRRAQSSAEMPGKQG